MAPEWMSPLLISALRLVFIATLSIVNWAALWRLACSSRSKSGEFHSWILCNFSSYWVQFVVVPRGDS